MVDLSQGGQHTSCQVSGCDLLDRVVNRTPKDPYHSVEWNEVSDSGLKTRTPVHAHLLMLWHILGMSLAKVISSSHSGFSLDDKAAT